MSILFIVLAIVMLVLLILQNIQVKELKREVKQFSDLATENKSRNDILVRICADHEHFISDLRKREDEFKLRSKGRGVR